MRIFKKFYPYISSLLVVSFIFSILIPSQNIFANSEQQILESSSQEVSISNNISIKVATFKPNYFVKVISENQNNNLGSYCNINNVAHAPNLIAQPATLNLNLPASCYSLQVNRIYSSQTKLEVKPLYFSASNFKIVVASEKIAIPALASYPNVPNTPVVPISVFTLTLTYILFKRGKIKTRLLLVYKELFNFLNLEQLQVFRC